MSESPFSHAPVMLEEAMRALNVRDGGLFIDATFGAGGYSRALLGDADTRVLALDRDPSVRPTADRLTAAAHGRFVFVEARFSALDEVVAAAGDPSARVDGVVMDVGVSSMQLDQPERGFSFRADGPLDMRMGADGPTAADAVAVLSEAELHVIFQVYGEEKRAGRAAAAIVRARAEEPITGTARLAAIVAEAVGGAGQKIHPATRVFQALRIYINDELGELARALVAAERVLRPGGRLVVVSFHSLEDRIVKTFLRARAGLEARGSRHAPEVEPTAPASFRLVYSGAETASEAELADNPRARSAKLRAGVRTEAAPWGEADGALPRLDVRAVEALV